MIDTTKRANPSAHALADFTEATTTCEDAAEQLDRTIGRPLSTEQRARLHAIGAERLFAALEVAWSDLDAGTDRAFEILADVRGVPRDPDWSIAAT